MTADARTRREKVNDFIWVNWPVVAVFAAVIVVLAALAVVFGWALQYLIDNEIRHIQHVITTTTIPARR